MFALDPDAARAASAFARRIKGVQDILGAHQDAVLASEELKRAARLHSEPEFIFVAGSLFEREQTVANESRAAFFESWRVLDRKKLRRWLKP